MRGYIIVSLIAVCLFSSCAIIGGAPHWTQREVWEESDGYTHAVGHAEHRLESIARELAFNDALAKIREKYASVARSRGKTQIEVQRFREVRNYSREKDGLWYYTIEYRGYVLIP